MAKSLQSLSDSELLDVATQVHTAMVASPAAYGTTAPAMAGLNALIATFDGNLTDSINQRALAKASVATKDASRTPLVDELRRLRDGANAAGATPAEMAATAIPVGGEKVPPAATVPVAAVDTSQRLRHTISWTEATTPDNKRKPRGTMGCDIYVKLGGAPPVDEHQCTFVTTDSATPYTVEYSGTDAGQMAHYMVRWRMRDGTVGPWGETVSATVTG